tara:strand:- start:246 stop:866 length:621 start_codon:yes stop_codon:yes gene_type:complete
MIIFPKKNSKKKPNLFFKEYVSSLKACANNIDFNKLEKISRLVEQKIINRKNIFVLGNGGAASVANHFSCDFNKGIKLSSNKKLLPKIISLSNQVELITAISNDINYENIFEFQIENFIEEGDCIFAMSCSGTSKNVIKLLKKIEKRKISIILITGFLKKKPNTRIDYHLDLGCKNYGITEDLFSSIMHMISQNIRYKHQETSDIL